MRIGIDARAILNPEKSAPSGVASYVWHLIKNILDIDQENGLLLQTRPAFGGNIMATIICAKHRPQMATVRTRVFEMPVPDSRRQGQIIPIKAAMKAAG